MKVLAFNGSARKDGNTVTLLKRLFRELERESIETDLIQLAGQRLRGCMACGSCFERKNRQCAVEDDAVNAYIERMIDADGIVLASPVYFANVSSELKALIDRAGMVGKANDDLFKRKVGAAVVAVRRAGAVQTFDSINHFFLIGQMIVPGSSYWNMGFGLAKGEVADDEEGQETMATLGRNMAWLLKKIHP